MAEAAAQAVSAPMSRKRASAQVSNGTKSGSPFRMAAR